MSPPRPTRGGVLRGIGFMIGATLLFVWMNTGVKFLSPYLPTAELIWARSLGHLVFVVAIFAPGHGWWRLFVTRKPAVQVTRSLLLITSTSLFFIALAHVPLADAIAVSFTTPIIAAALAGPTLGERVSLHQWLAIGAGFCGALIIIRPGGEGASPYALLVLGSAACYAGYQILTRHVSRFDSPETSVSYSALVGTALLSAAVPFFWKAPEQLSHWLIISVLGVLGGLGHYCVARALLWGPVAIISPFHYAQLLWAAVVGYLLFGDAPSAWTWIGAAIIMTSGLYVALQETRPRRA